MPDHTIAFFAAIKPPDHHIPSGDRLIAQNIIKSINLTRHKVELASRYICYSKHSDKNILEVRKSGAIEEAERLIRNYTNLPKSSRPDVWLTYHPYCKAPDWIGPRVSSTLDIPYVTMEAARTVQGEPEDAWKLWREEAQTGIRQADHHIVMKPSDRAYLTQLLGSDIKLHGMKPFMDTDSIKSATPKKLPNHWAKDTPVVITTGMMRKGKKEQNFKILVEVLRAMEGNFNLIIVGGGPEEQAVRAAFSGMDAKRIHWTGQIEQQDVLSWMQSSDIFIWPGWKEPIGMVYLEAQLQGLPVIAYKSMGVPLVVEHGKTGLLSPEDDIEAMRLNLGKLLGNTNMRFQMGNAARDRVIAQHGLKPAAERLSEILDLV